jgi:hypothetical protein
MYTTFRDLEYDDYFPGISNAENESKFRELYRWAFTSVVTHFLHKEYYMAQSIIMPVLDMLNHKQNKQNSYR